MCWCVQKYICNVFKIIEILLSDSLKTAQLDDDPRDERSNRNSFLPCRGICGSSGCESQKMVSSLAVETSE